MADFVHHVPGRLRVRIPALKRNEAEARAALRLIEAACGVMATKANLLTGSLTARYDSRLTSGAALLAILHDAGYRWPASDAEAAAMAAACATQTAAPNGNGRARKDGSQTAKAPPPRGGEALGETVLRLAVDKVIERLATTAVGALVFR